MQVQPTADPRIVTAASLFRLYLPRRLAQKLARLGFARDFLHEALSLEMMVAAERNEQKDPLGYANEEQATFEEGFLAGVVATLVFVTALLAVAFVGI